MGNTSTSHRAGCTMVAGAVQLLLFSVKPCWLCQNARTYKMSPCLSRQFQAGGAEG